MRIAIIPAYNEEATIGRVVSNLSRYVYEVIVVDDCSSDRTKSIADDNGAIVFSNSRNLGYEKTLNKAISIAICRGASTILSFDADDQHPYNSVEKMFKIIEAGRADIVVGARKSLPRLSEKLFSYYTDIKYGIPDILCGMKCYSAATINETGVSRNWNSIGSYITIKALKLKLNVMPLSIDIKSRRSGASRFGISIKSEFTIFNAFIKSLLI